jgi:hypothetical protein
LWGSYGPQISRVRRSDRIRNMVMDILFLSKPPAEIVDPAAIRSGGQVHAARAPRCRGCPCFARAPGNEAKA